MCRGGRPACYHALWCLYVCGVSHVWPTKEGKEGGRLYSPGIILLSVSLLMPLPLHLFVSAVSV